MADLTLIDGSSASRFAFGTMQWGGAADEATAHALYETCRNAGITHFDTAVSYTGGLAENFLGQFCKFHREEIFVATKIGYDHDTDPAELRVEFDKSRRQLGMERIDLLYLHRFDPDTPLEATFELFAQLKSEGAIRHIGVSNFAAWQVMKAQNVCAKLGVQIEAIQPMYNLVKRQAEVELLPMALDQNLSVMAYSPLGGGLLTGKYATGGSGRLASDQRYAARYALATMHDAAAGLTGLAHVTGQSEATLAVAWVAAHPTRPNPIISARSVEQLKPSLEAMHISLSPDLYTQLVSLYPSPAPANDRLEEA